MVYLFLGDVLSHCDDSSDPTGDVTGCVLAVDILCSEEYQIAHVTAR